MLTIDVTFQKKKNLWRLLLCKDTIYLSEKGNRHPQVKRVLWVFVILRIKWAWFDSKWIRNPIGLASCLYNVFQSFCQSTVNKLRDPSAVLTILLRTYFSLAMDSFLSGHKTTRDAIKCITIIIVATNLKQWHKSRYDHDPSKDTWSASTP